MSRLENFNNFAQAVRVIDSKRSLKELKKNIKALSTQEEQQGIKFLWDNLPEGFPKIRPRESIINTARAIAFGQRVVNFHQVPMELNNLSVDQQISQETSDEVPEEALRNLTNNERKSKRRKRARKKRTKKKTKTNTNTHTNTKAKTKTYTNTNTIPEVHNKDEYKRKVDLPPKEYWHFGWCILSFVIGWGFIIGLCFVAVPCSKVRFWDLHINNCEIDWTKTTRNASFADRHGKTHQGTLQSGCAPKEDNQNIKGKYSCWSNPKDSSQIHMVPEYRTAACVAAISCGAILGFIFQLPIPLAPLIWDYDISIPHRIGIFCFCLMIFPVMPFIAPFWGKKGLPIPIAAIVLWILLIYFSILRPANIEESNYDKTICKVYDFDYTVDCPFCQLAGFYCGVIFPSSTSDPISPIVSYWSGDLKLVVKLYPEKYPDLGKSPPVQIPWQKWGKHAYKAESSKRLQPTINDRVECYVENDYKYTDSSDMYQPKILTEIKKSGSGYKTGLAFIIILPVIWAIIFLAMMRHLY